MVFVLDKHKKALMPCTEKRARQLLEKKRAVIHKMFPFTIRMKDIIQEESKLQELRLKIDPGSRTTGIALVSNENVLLLGELEHKTIIKKLLEDRREKRRNRRNRKTRYRKCRFDRKKGKGWISPSMRARIDQTLHLVQKFKSLAPLTGISFENVKFDTQKMDNPEISGVEYQQGELWGYEVREYLLEKFGRKCAYCGAENVPLQIEHIIPKARGGTNRVNNLTLACKKCNLEKGTKTAAEYGFPNITKDANKTYKDAAFMNSTRWRLFEKLKSNHVPVESGSGGLTKLNRTRHNLPKEHYYDALCVGFSTPNELNFKTKYVQEYKYMGRGRRQMCQTNAYGTPIKHRQRKKNYFGFYTGDIVKANKPKGKNAGELLGRVTVSHKAGSFKINSIYCNPKYMKILQRNDGWQYDKRIRNTKQIIQSGQKVKFGGAV